MNREQDWLIPIALLAGVEWLWAFVLAELIDYPADPYYSPQYALAAAIGCCMFAAFLIVNFVRMARILQPSPVRAMGLLIWENRDRHALIGAGLFFLALHMAAFNWSKSMLPFAIPFWADQPLADFDDALFGMEAWRWTYQLTGQASEIFRRAYGFWLPLHFIVLAFVLCLPPSERKVRLLIAYMLTWVFGTITSFLFSSAGPLFYGKLGFGSRFADLAGQPHLSGIVRTASYLWQNYLDQNAMPGAGISAFPSLHVASALWIAAALGFHWIGLIFFGLVFVGSFLLGWHYFLDAPAGAACFLTAYLLAGRYVAWRTNRGLATLHPEGAVLAN